ncbi:MAG: trypsin-like peptidase domain-containing protein [Actinobacteria bacterium]|nr:trypsin-like peptidase domain-containing protein [Actinomycetota bacterium]
MPPLDPAVADDGDVLDVYSRTVAGVAERLLPSVASLEVRRRIRGRWQRAGAGSAVVLTPDGFLVTSAHVVDGATGGVAEFADGTRADLEVVGTDRLSDLAVVRVAATDLPAVTLGDAAQLRVGQLVVAIGNPLGYAGSVSAGVVSAVGRSLTAATPRTARLIENVIQTDAALHPGNSGGALADSAGRVVGINTALVGPGLGQGLGMAIPIDAGTRTIVGALLRDGRVRRAYLGIGGGVRPLPPRAAASLGRSRGVEITTVEDDGPAALAGLRPEDIIVSVDGVAIETVGALQAHLTDAAVDREVELRIIRSGQLTSIPARPAELQE